MQISIETTAGLERRLTISVPSEAFEQKISERLGEAATRVRLPGFRPGRVPMKEVRRRFGQAVRVEVAGELMQSSFVTAIRQEDLNPAGQPSLEVVQMDPGNDFEFTATFEVFPLVELVNLGKAELRKPVAEITEADVDQMIERLREQRKTWETVERPAAEGDRVTIDFVGRLDGEPFEGGSAEGQQFVIGAGQMIEDFDRGVRGLAPGQQGTFDATFPADYRAEQLAGKTVTFDVTVRQVEASRLPELDDAFFEAFAVSDGGIEALRADVRRNMQRELEDAVRKQLKSQVMDQLNALHNIQLPRTMIEREMEALRQQMLQQFRMYGSAGQPDLPLDLFREQAERRVNVGLVVSEIVRSANLAADPAQVRARIEQLAEGYADPQQVVNWYYSNAEQLEQIELAVLEDLVVDHVLAAARVAEVPGSYQDVISGKTLAPEGAEAGAERGAATGAEDQPAAEQQTP
ncbi:MAG: trigger factor [Pseudomonadales bacterium]|nr:trigger factor [Pseudomonadales bacterium]